MNLGDGAPLMSHGAMHRELRAALEVLYTQSGLQWKEMGVHAIGRVPLHNPPWPFTQAFHLC